VREGIDVEIWDYITYVAMPFTISSRHWRPPFVLKKEKYAKDSEFNSKSENVNEVKDIQCSISDRKEKKIAILLDLFPNLRLPNCCTMQATFLPSIIHLVLQSP